MKDITLFTIAVIATFLVAAVTVGTDDVFAPIAILPDVDEQRLALDLERENDVPGVDEGGKTESNENSKNSAAKIERSTDHDVGGASAAGQSALQQEESIETPNKDIEREVESAEESSASNSKLVWESVDNPT